MTLHPEALGPVPAPGPEPVALDLLRRSAALAAAAARTRAKLDAEAVHDLRVAARRLEAALRVWAPAAPGTEREARAARRGARRLRRAAGNARELEVHVELLESRVLPEAAAERSALLPVLAGLRARRDRARTEAAALARPRALARIADRVAAVAAALVPTHEAFAAADVHVRGAREAAADGLAAAAGTSDDGRLHAARIAVKKWRYAEESRAASDVPRRKAPLGALRAAQRALGEVHDHAVLRDLLRREARRADRAGEPARWSRLAAVVLRLESARRALLQELPRKLRALSDAVRR